MGIFIMRIYFQYVIILALGFYGSTSLGMEKDEGQEPVSQDFVRIEHDFDVLTKEYEQQMQQSLTEGMSDFIGINVFDMLSADLDAVRFKYQGINNAWLTARTHTLNNKTLPAIDKGYDKGTTGAGHKREVTSAKNKFHNDIKNYMSAFNNAYRKCNWILIHNLTNNRFEIHDITQSEKETMTDAQAPRVQGI